MNDRERDALNRRREYYSAVRAHERALDQLRWWGLSDLVHWRERDDEERGALPAEHPLREHEAYRSAPLPTRVSLRYRLATPVRTRRACRAIERVMYDRRVMAAWMLSCVHTDLPGPCPSEVHDWSTRPARAREGDECHLLNDEWAART